MHTHVSFPWVKRTSGKLAKLNHFAASFSSMLSAGEGIQDQRSIGLSWQEQDGAEIRGSAKAEGTEE